MRLFFPVPDKEKDHQAYMVYVLSIVWAVTITIVVGVTWAMFPGLWQRYFLFTSIAVFIGVFNLSLNQWVSTKLASWSLPITCWLIVTLSCYTAGGIQSPHLLTQIVVILTAAYLLGWRGGLAFGLISAGVDLLYAYMAEMGTLPEPTIVHTPMSRWIGALIPFGTILVLQHYATNHLRTSLSAMRREMAQREKAEKARSETLHDMNERVKELRTLYRVSNILQDETSSIEKLFTEIAELLPSGWQYPEITAAKVFLGDAEFISKNYHPTEYSQRAELKTKKSTKVGIEVVYLVDRSESDEGPFLKEERRMIDALVEMLKTYLDERERLSELKDYQFALDEAALVSVSSVEGNFTFVNENFCKASRYSYEELMGAHHSIIWSGLHPPEYFDELTVAMQNGAPFRGEFCNKAKDGSLYWVDSTVVPFLNRDGKVYQYLSINTDITERKKATEMFQHQFENSPDLIVIVDKEHRIESMNRTLPGRPEPETFLGKDAVEVLPEEHWEVARNSIDACFGGKGIIEIENSLRNGRWVRSRFVPIVIDGAVRNVMVIATDITEQREAELRLRQSEEKNRALVENIAEAIVLIDANEDIIYQSPAVTKITGYDPEDSYGVGSFEFIHPLDVVEFRKFLGEVIGTPGVPFQRQFRVLHKDGHTIWVEGTLVNMLDNDSINGIVVNYRDITERLNAEKEKQEIQERTMAMLEDKVVERTQELHDTNQILATKNVEITDSINYAVNIQRAMLSKAEDCFRIFPDSFLFWRPKDIVSGDFCWCYSNGTFDFVAVVDCTGHGVPGALMSLIANQMFDRVVNIEGVLEPKEILEQLNHAIVTSLNQETGLVKDGMDLALCRIDKQNSELKFAGAQLPMYYFNNGELIVVEGSKAGIGGLISEDRPKQFIQETIKYNAGDTFYLTSDGYYDQFGGDRGKKMMKKRFRELLSTVVSKPIQTQPIPLGEYLDEWRGDEEQVDDVMVIGVRL